MPPQHNTTPLGEVGDGPSPSIGIRLTREQREKLRALAEARGVSVSALLRRLIEISDRIDLPEPVNAGAGPPDNGG